jgi:hypothetical protein
MLYKPSIYLGIESLSFAPAKLQEATDGKHCHRRSRNRNKRMLPQQVKVVGNLRKLRRLSGRVTPRERSLPKVPQTSSRVFLPRMQDHDLDLRQSVVTFHFGRLMRSSSSLYRFVVES